MDFNLDFLFMALNTNRWVRTFVHLQVLNGLHFHHHHRLEELSFEVGAKDLVVFLVVFPRWLLFVLGLLTL